MRLSPPLAFLSFLSLIIVRGCDYLSSLAPSFPSLISISVSLGDASVTSLAVLSFLNKQLRAMGSLGDASVPLLAVLSFLQK